MIFVLPSDMKGLSLALLDAMGAGLCVLTSDVPENREAVEGAGFTFQTRNVEDLSERLRFLIAYADARAKSGMAARARIEEQYDWNKVTDDIELVYFDVLGRQRERSAVMVTLRRPNLPSVWPVKFHSRFPENFRFQSMRYLALLFVVCEGAG